MSSDDSDEASESEGDESHENHGEDSFERLREGTRGTSAGDGAAEREDGDPFADLDLDADLDADRDDGPGPERDDEADPFDTVDVDDVPIEEIWATIDGEDDDTTALSVGGAAEQVETDEHLVDKSDYCARCPYLDAPPELSCTHDGTSIVAVEDAGRFRVRSCPMVERGPPGETDD